jgi:hypothetical protein
MTAPVEDPWQILDFFKSAAIAIVISSNVACEAFFFLSAFIGAYQFFRILEAQNRRILNLGDLLKMYLRKYLRLAPFYYFVLFLGWSSCSYISDGPAWNIMQGLWYNCSSTWYYKMMFVGNIVGFQ